MEGLIETLTQTFNLLSPTLNGELNFSNLAHLNADGQTESS